MRANVSIATDDLELAHQLGEILDQLDLQLHYVNGSVAVREAIEGTRELVVIASSAGADDTGVLLAELTRHGSVTPVVLVAPSGAAPAAQTKASSTLGMLHILHQPFEREEALRIFRRALDASSQTAPQAPAGDDASLLPLFIGESKAMQHVDSLLRRAAPTDSTILVRGESGTGKELLARAVHELSHRRRGPLVKVHCAALPDTLLESELFGYERGAFTGASSTKPGRVELAQGGTLFLDEIGDITPAVQVKLLRLLQDREFERLGGKHAMKADVRFVAATHRDLEAMTKLGTFRDDLFYRLNVITLWVPPLRTRRSDIGPLAEIFCRSVARLCGRPQLTLAPGALELLRRQRWPGNVRELQNFVERLVVLSEGPSILAEDVARELEQRSVTFRTQTAEGTLQPAQGSSAPNVLPSAGAFTARADIQPLSAEMHAAERRALERALERTAGNRVLAARSLGISRATLYKKLQEHGLT